MQKSENLFFIRFRTLRVILDKKKLHFLRGRGVCLSLTRTGHIFYQTFHTWLIHMKKHSLTVIIYLYRPHYIDSQVMLFDCIYATKIRSLTVIIYSYRPHYIDSQVMLFDCIYATVMLFDCIYVTVMLFDCIYATVTLYR